MLVDRWRGSELFFPACRLLCLRVCDCTLSFSYFVVLLTNHLEVFAPALLFTVQPSGTNFFSATPASKRPRTDSKAPSKSVVAQQPTVSAPPSIPTLVDSHPNFGPLNLPFPHTREAVVLLALKLAVDYAFTVPGFSDKLCQLVSDGEI